MRLVLLVDLPADHKYHRASVVALEHAVATEKLSASVVAIRTDELTGDIDQLGSGVVIGPGSPYNNPSAANAAIEQARKTGIPLVGTWGGFQHVLVEHAINNLGIEDAVHAEYGDSGIPIVSLLACSLNGKEITVRFSEGSKLSSWHGASESVEQTTCNYGMNPEFQEQASQSGLIISATDETGEVRAVERPDHPFFVGTLYQPQLTTSAGSPHPIFTAFVKAAAQRNQETENHQTQERHEVSSHD